MAALSQNGGTTPAGLGGGHAKLPLHFSLWQVFSAGITSEEEKVHFCKWLWTVLRKLHSCINSTSNISHEHNKVQECNQSFWHKKHTALKKMLYLFICLAYLTVDHTGRNNHKYLVTWFHQVLACATLGLSQAHIMASPIRTKIAVQSSVESHPFGQLPSPITSSPTVCGILYKELVFSKSESSSQPEAHAPSKNSVYFMSFIRKASGFQCN